MGSIAEFIFQNFLKDRRIEQSTIDVPAGRRGGSMSKNSATNQKPG